MHDGALPYATFLIGAAWEELMKDRYCVDTGGPSWPDWWKGFRDHKTKMALAERYWPELPTDQAATLRDLRERSLYVEVKQDGDPLTPRGLVEPGGLRRDFLQGLSRWISGECLATLQRLAEPHGLSLPAIGK